MGLIGDFAPGQYTLYVRVLDGAGNASNAFATTPPIQVDTTQRTLVPAFALEVDTNTRKQAPPSQIWLEGAFAMLQYCSHGD